MTDENRALPADGLEEIVAALQRATESLDRLDHTRPFSAPAFVELQRTISVYIRDLMVESARTAGRRNVDQINATDVDTAAKYLSSSKATSLANNGFATVGGILLGSGLGNGLAMISNDGPPAAIGIIATLLLVMVGTALVAVSLARELR